MAILALDTSLGACQVGLFDAGRMIGGASEAMERGHQERLAPMTAEVMQAAGLDFSDIARIVVTLGPGSFTGLRVGLAFARGLHLATGAELSGVGSLAALAGGDEGAGLTLAAIDARRGHVYWQAFQDGEPLGEPQASGIDEVGTQMRGRHLARLVGPGAPLLQPLFPEAAVDALAAPKLSSLGRLAGLAAPDADIRPIYLRPAVAAPA